jgi:hypothetical protein
LGVVVEEEDYALAAEDHGGEGGPVVERHGDLGGDEDELIDAGGFYGSDVGGYGGVVAVAD